MSKETSGSPRAPAVPPAKPEQSRTFLGSPDPELELGWEEYPWSPTHPQHMSRRQLRDSEGPYRAAIPARIAPLDLSVPSSVEAESADAAVAVTRFDADVSHALAGDDGAEIAPLAVVLLRTESASSSQIENVTAGAQALALATIGAKTGPNAAMVAENVSAMQTALSMSGRIDKDSLLAMHRALMAETHPEIAGQFRAEQVWIGGGNFSPHRAAFVPPHHTRVDSALDDLTAFCERDDIPPLTQAAIAHAQFETIHPFVDGNGRVGRALVHAMLRRSGVTRRMTVPVSAGLLTDTSSYFAALTSYRTGYPGSIVSEFSRASHAAVANGSVLVADLLQARQSWVGRIRARRDAAVWQVLDLIIRQPAVTVAVVREALGVSQPTAQSAIDELIRAAILRKDNDFRRNRVWVAPEVLEALDAFAQRAGRRYFISP
jgi:Fic family protein